ncbi:glycosyltransferase [bacterium]|nr:glycosyltransferase [bacterium]
MKPVLLIAYKFPPYSMVGAYRWTKLSRKLAEIGHEVHVVTVDWKSMGHNAHWLNEVDHPNIHIYRIPSGNPLHFWVQTKPLNRITSKIRKLLFSLVNFFFFFDDEAQRWGTHLIPYCEQLIQEQKITTIIATGHPFQSNRFAGDLKERFPHLQLIQDLRDPWIEDNGKKLNTRHYDRVLDWEKRALKAADDVVSVSPTLLKSFEKYETSARFHWIPNGVDQQPEESFLKYNKGIHICYAGNIFCGREEPLMRLLMLIQSQKADFSQLKITIIGGIHYSIKKTFQPLIDSGCLELIPHQAQEAVYMAIKKSHFALHLNAKRCPGALSTKIYEYAALKVPVISLNYGGDIEQLIHNYKFGVSINLDKVNDASLKKTFLDTISTNTREINPDVSPFYFQNLAKKYSSIVQASSKLKSV